MSEKLLIAAVLGLVLCAGAVDWTAGLAAFLAVMVTSWVEAAQ